MPADPCLSEPNLRLGAKAGFPLYKAENPEPVGRMASRRSSQLSYSRTGADSSLAMRFPASAVGTTGGTRIADLSVPCPFPVRWGLLGVALAAVRLSPHRGVPSWYRSPLRRDTQYLVGFLHPGRTVAGSARQLGAQANEAKRPVRYSRQLDRAVPPSIALTGSQQARRSSIREFKPSQKVYSGSARRPCRSRGRVYISTFWPGCGAGHSSFGRSQ